MTTQPWIYLPTEKVQYWCPVEFDLSAAAVVAPIFYHGGLPQIWGNEVTTVKAVITDIFILYTEASSADAGIGLELGKPTDTNQFWTQTSEINKSLWDATRYTNSDASFANDRIFNTDEDILLFRCSGSKTGTGKIRVGLTISYNYKDYVSFTP